MSYDGGCGDVNCKLCQEDARAAGAAQRSLFEPSEEARLSGQRKKILERLMDKSDVSSVELNGIAQRFGARIFELRKMGHQIKLVSRDRARGITWYRLIGA